MITNSGKPFYLLCGGLVLASVLATAGWAQGQLAAAQPEFGAWSGTICVTGPRGEMILVDTRRMSPEKLRRLMEKSKVNLRRFMKENSSEKEESERGRHSSKQTNHFPLGGLWIDGELRGWWSQEDAQFRAFPLTTAHGEKGYPYKIDEEGNAWVIDQTTDENGELVNRKRFVGKVSNFPGIRDAGKQK